MHLLLTEVITELQIPLRNDQAWPAD
jgi:hypothetical protein